MHRGSAVLLSAAAAVFIVIMNAGESRHCHTSHQRDSGYARRSQQRVVAWWRSCAVSDRFAICFATNTESRESAGHASAIAKAPKATEVVAGSGAPLRGGAASFRLLCVTPPNT